MTTNQPFFQVFKKILELEKLLGNRLYKCEILSAQEFGNDDSKLYMDFTEADLTIEEIREMGLMGWRWHCGGEKLTAHCLLDAN
ncbi:MAG: hypothetical protein NUV91_02750 [Candidatus Omnitrophica bacterium]|nr:hypothetical protein [Candidatus Omnitrophota bacterium]